MIQPKPTKTFVLDCGRHCNINCRFCYYHHLGDLRHQGWETYDKMTSEVDAGIARGNSYCDITGGEPTLFPQIEELIKYNLSKRVKTCIITNALTGKNKLNNIIMAGIDEFLVSVHGPRTTHDMLVQQDGARDRQEFFLHTIKQCEVKLRFNFVLNKYNQEEIVETAMFMAKYKPSIINFINMNPHHGWANDPNTANVIADLNIVEEQLNHAIDTLYKMGIGVNVRYYPMCRIAERHRKCICNDLHVVFDPFEWDYSMKEKTFEHYRNTWIANSNNVEEKGEPCCQCDLQWICGGANKHFHAAAKTIYGEILIPQKMELEDKNFFYYYRKDNAEVLYERN